MKPYNKEFWIEKIKEYNNLISDSEHGEFRITKNVLPKENLYGYMYKNKETLDVEIIELYKGKDILMKLDPREIEGSYEAIKFASGRVGIVGLGIGYVVQEMAKKQDVKEIIVYEISEEVIELYKKNFKDNDKIKIIQGDAFKAERNEFDFFYVDIYGYKLPVKIVNDYKRFNKLHKIEEYSFFGMEHFLLSCNYEDLLWVYIPEVWVAMSKDIYDKLSSSGYIEKYVRLTEKRNTNLLLRFKEVLNSDM